MSMELISVIVPIYNCEKYLRECIDSILSNSYQTLEVILVNDGSTDSSPAICDEYSLRDPRINVIHQENTGIVGARNTGLAHAQGRYVAFVDADDVVSSTIYEIMVNAMESTGADIATCEFCTKTEDLSAAGGEMHMFETYDDQLAIIMTAPWMRKVSWTSVSVWNKLYKKSGIKKQFNESCLMCEDLRFNLDYIEFSRKMVVISSSLYFYRQHEMSIMSMYRKKQGNIENGVVYSKLLIEIAKGYPRQNSEMANYLDARAAYSAHGALWRIFAQKKEKEFQAYVSEGRALIRRNYEKIWKDKSTYGVRIRAGIGLFNYCFPIWRTAVCIFEWYASGK